MSIKICRFITSSEGSTCLLPPHRGLHNISWLLDKAKILSTRRQSIVGGCAGEGGQRTGRCEYGGRAGGGGGQPVDQELGISLTHSIGIIHGGLNIVAKILISIVFSFHV